MESMRWNLRMQRCDLASRGSASSAAKCVLSEPYEPVIPVFPLVAKDCYEIPITVKVEGDDEVDDISCQGSQEGDVHLLKTDVGLFAKEGENFIVKTDNDMVEVAVKQELDIGPMVLQPKSTPCELPPPTLEDDFVKSTESETVEVMVKQELDIGPLVLQPKTIPCQFLSPTLPSLPDPCPSLLDHYPSFSWANDMAPATPYLGIYLFYKIIPERMQPKPLRKPRTEVELFNSRRNSGSLFDDCSVLDSKRTVDIYQNVLREQSYYCFDREDKSVDPQDGGQCRYSANSLTANVTTYSTDALVGSKPFIYHQYNEIKTFMDKQKNITLTHCEENPCKSKQFEYNTSRVGDLRTPLSTYTSKSLGECENITSRPSHAKTQAIISVGKKLHKCEHCDYSTSRISNLFYHMRTHTGEKPYKCEQCKYRACRLDSLKRHMRTHTGEKPYKCEHCGYDTSRVSNLKNHMRTHTGEKPYLCEHCEYRTSHFRSLQLHTRIHTGEKPYRCERCEYSASHITSIKRHMHTHTGEKPFKCGICEYGTTQMSNLKIHMRMHTGEKPYKCEHCEYSASYVGSVKTHMRTHTGDKPYKCELCAYSTSHVGAIKSHMRTHTGDKPYKCEHCEYSACHINGLKSHMRIHTGEKPYECEQCEYRASNVGNLRRHKRIHMIEKLNNVGSLSTVLLN
ncbi:Zinc finger protein 678 [Eumeta japonica]|uniref:Zinc finger protein 678 n=1 Tax=Eumeta variegata TaxID=151549 RepID=A0A4C1YWW1_EUMVA|nr:Zinc finger protein 678 [Eumeta japonica]